MTEAGEMISDTLTFFEWCKCINPKGPFAELKLKVDRASPLMENRDQITWEQFLAIAKAAAQ
jgi:hypothetical protein